MGSYEFDTDTAVSGRFTLTDRWSAFGGVNGGYMLAVCVRALGAAVPFPDPIVASGFFLRPGTPGPAEIRTSVLRAGRTTAFGQASLWRGDREIVHATGAFSNLGGAVNAVDGPAGVASGPAGLVFANGEPPALPPPDECAAVPGGALPGISIADRIEYRSAELPGWFRGSPSGAPVAEFWMRFKDGREPDLWALPLLVDAAAPVVLEIGAMSTTVELTVHLRARPAPGWLACRASTRFAGGGYHEEDFEIWDSAGTLVAQSRQLALVVAP
jgi:acyl-coenzyme A thioesterase PaaI-like protein